MKRGVASRRAKSESRIRSVEWDSVWLWRIEFGVERHLRERDRGG